MLNMTTIPGWYTSEEAANYLELSPWTIKRYAERGLLRHEKVGRSLVFCKAELDRYRRERRPPGRPPGQHDDN